MILHNGRCGSTVVGNLLAQNPNMHWASELYEPMFAKWKEENQQEFAYLAKEPIVENPIAILKNSMNEVTKPYYGFCANKFPTTVLPQRPLCSIIILFIFSFVILLIKILFVV